MADEIAVLTKEEQFQTDMYSLSMEWALPKERVRPILASYRALQAKCEALETNLAHENRRAEHFVSTVELLEGQVDALEKERDGLNEKLLRLNASLDRSIAILGANHGG